MSTPSPSKFYYGWVIACVCGLTLLVVFGIRLSFTVFFVALTESFAWPRADTSLIFSISMIVFAVTSPIAGLALDRWGVRPVFSVGVSLLALGLLLSSRIQTLAQLAFTYGFVSGVGITVLGLGLQASVVSRWFRQRRGVAIGITFAGTGLGSLLLTPGVALMIERIGWRAAYVVLGGVAFLLLWPIIHLLRLNPAQLQLLPDGAGRVAQINEMPLQATVAPAIEWTMWQVVQTPSFWLIILASLGAIGPLRLLTVHQLAAIVEAGFERLYAASVVGVAGAVTAVSFITFGALSDRIGRRAAYTIGSLCLLTAFLVLGNLPRLGATSWLWLYALALGLGEGSRASLLTAVASDLFPGNALGVINGSVGSAFGLGAAFFPWLAGRLYDLSGVYTLAFQVAGTAVVLSTIALWLAPQWHQSR